MKKELQKLNELTRQHVLKGLAASYLSLNFFNAFSAYPIRTKKQGGQAKSVIFIRVTGGLSQVDSFDIKEDNREANLASKPIKTSADGIRVGKYFEKMAKHMDKVAIINSMQHTTGVHELGNYLMDKGYVKRGTVTHPDLGAWISRLGNRQSGNIPPYVKVDKVGSLGAGFFSTKYSALPISNPYKGLQSSALPEDVNQSMFKDRIDLLSRVNAELTKTTKTKWTQEYHLVYKEALKLMQSDDLKVFDIDREPQNIRDTYGDNNFGTSCLLARRLVEQGVSFIQLTHNGWDDHYDIYDVFGPRAQSLDQGVAALLADLENKGLLDTTLIALSTEFGRGAKLNSQGGRGHNPRGYTSLLAGGGIRGGQKYGSTDKMGGKAIKNIVSVGDFHSTIAYALGVPYEKIINSPEGRPFRLGKKGKPITALF